MARFVLVHGAGTGGWLWDDVAELLRGAGHQVSAPSLQGVGDQSAEDGANVNLTTHVEQVVQLVQHDGPDPVVLVGFSYGGFVVTGAADRLDAQVSRLIYLEAFLPTPGRSFLDLLPDATRTTMQSAADAFGGGQRVPPAPVEMVGGIGALEPGVQLEHVHAVLRRRGFHPMGSYTEPFPSRPDPAPQPTVFISCTDKPNGDPLIALAGRLRGQGWRVQELPTGHFAMITMPQALTRLLLVASAAPSLGANVHHHA